MSEQDKKLNLAKVYEFRFTGLSQGKKDATWALITRWIESRLDNPKSVLDPAAGRGEFIISSRAAERWACDLSDQRKNWPTGITTRFGDIYNVDLPENHFDLIFVSNFLEHLATPDDVYKYLMQLRKSLKPGGKLAIMGPNFRFSANEYYDFADHLLPLSDRTVEEHLAAVDMKCERIVPRFLPLAFRSQRFSHPLLVKLYLAVPFFWRFYGKQFFIVATRLAD
jgi:SAM-dependent methyltransferase